MRNVPRKSRRINQPYIVCSVTLFRKSYRLWDKVEKFCRAGQATDNNMARLRICCWLPKATDADREYAIIAFQLQQCLPESAPILRCIISCLVDIIELIPKLRAGMFLSSKFINRRHMTVVHECGDHAIFLCLSAVLYS
jgi:hypothetical protein